jgi:GT2 family glycosyltransferase
MDISFIIVNYNSEAFLKKCLKSLHANVKGISFEIIIINNDKKTLNQNDLSIDSSIKIINSGKNNGFAKACNVGAQVANGKFLFFLNPDTEFIEFDAKSLIKIFEKQTVGIIGPKLLTADKKPQPWSTGYATSLADIIKNNFGYIKSKAAWENEKQIEVDWVSGAALIMPRLLFSEVDGFDEGFFMYFEDMDLCSKIKSHGQKIIMDPQFKILHLEGQSYDNKKVQKKEYYASQDYFFKKHFGFVSLFMLKLLRKTALISA